MTESIRTIFLDASAVSVELREDLGMDASFRDLFTLYGGQSQPSDGVGGVEFEPLTKSDRERDL